MSSGRCRSTASCCSSTERLRRSRAPGRRGLEAKVLATREQLGHAWHVEGLLVVRGTRRNRGLVTQLRAVFAARYPGSSRGWLCDLSEPDAGLPGGAGFAWTTSDGERLLPARLG